MSDTGKQSPLGVNAVASLLQNIGLRINPQAASSMGSSTTVTNYSPGTICTNTCLNKLTASINAAYTSGLIDPATYASLISIGAGVMPALGNSPSATYTWTGSPGWMPYTGDITSWGYIKLFALQAYNEFNYNSTLPAYRDFLSSFNSASGFVQYSNPAILAVYNSATFLEGTYSNMNDLISADVAGVNLATVAFGQDFIATGKAIDLASIATFGLPSNLLMTLQRYNALTQSVTLALLSTGMSTSEISDILGKVNPITSAQELFIYSAFTIIMGQDLIDVCIPLNCKTLGLISLADLLNPQKLFPNSYSSLTVPVYNAAPGPTNSKTYYPIYEGTGVSSRLISMTIGLYLTGILPDDVAMSAGAFSTAMQQIRNIASTPAEKFAQVLGQIETTKGLTLINGSTIPTNIALATAASSLIALGSGLHGTYTMSDFFGCMSGLPYNWSRIQSLISELQSSTLVTIYNNLYLAVTDPIPDMVAINALILAANNEIKAIKVALPTKAAELNTLWDSIGTQLVIEQRARVTGLYPLSSPRDNNLSRFPTTQYSFVDSIPNMALDTAPNMASQTLEAISDLNTTGGQSIVGMMRQARNQDRLAAVGITLDNNIPAWIPVEEQSGLIANDNTSFLTQDLPEPGASGAAAVATVDGGIITDIIIIDPGSGYNEPPTVDIIPPGATATAVIADGIVIDIIVDDPGSGYTEPPTIILSGGIPTVTTSPETYGVYDPITNTYTMTNPALGGNGQAVDTGQVAEPGSLAGSPYTRLIPSNLNVMYTSDILLPATLTPAEAIDEVTVCNCDCWPSL